MYYLEVPLFTTGFDNTSQLQFCILRALNLILKLLEKISPCLDGSTKELCQMFKEEFPGGTSG